MQNEENIQPTETSFIKRGNSIYMKIPPQWHNFLGLQKLKQENTPNTTKGECYAQKSSKAEHYISGWNPNHPSQKHNEDDNQ
jgi:hypothetical protein